jgi:hypothetical protein
MPAFREQDFDKMATAVVDQFLSGRAKLAEAAAKQAMDAGLNPDQIERLAQSANTMTFLRLMENAKQAGAGELTQEFDPIDSRQVIRIVIDSTGVHVEPQEAMAAPPEDSHELPDEMAALRGAPPEGMPGHEEAETPEEEAAEHELKPEEEAEEKETPKAAELRKMRLRKLAGILEDQYKQAEWAFEDTSQQLVDRFRRVYNDVTFEAFEKDALAECDDAVGIHVLNAIRETRKLPALDIGVAMEKSAALKDRHVSDETPELALFETMVKIAREADKLRRGVALVRARCV